MNITLQEIKNLLAESNQDRFPPSGKYGEDQEGAGGLWLLDRVAAFNSKREKNRIKRQGGELGKIEMLRHRITNPDFVEAALIKKAANVAEEIANSTGGDVGAGEKGPIASIGVGVDGEPGASKRRKKFWRGRCKDEASQLGREVGFLRRANPL